MAQKVDDNAIKFSEGRGRNGRVHVGTYPVEDDETISMSWEGVSVTFVKRPGPNFVSQSTLTRSTIPPKRDGKRKHHPRRWAGEEQAGHTMRAIFCAYDEEGQQRDWKMSATKPETWTGTRSPECRRDVIEGNIEGEYQDHFWRAV